MRKKFLVLASVATMALAGTAMPAFADDGAAAAAAPARVPVHCTVTVAGNVVNTFTVNVPSQVITLAQSNLFSSSSVDAVTGAQATVTCTF